MSRFEPTTCNELSRSDYLREIILAQKSEDYWKKQYLEVHALNLYLMDVEPSKSHHGNGVVVVCSSTLDDLVTLILVREKFVQSIVGLNYWTFIPRLLAKVRKKFTRKSDELGFPDSLGAIDHQAFDYALRNLGFSSKGYRSTNPDVDNSGMIGLQHYLTTGKNEQRVGTSTRIPLEANGD